MFISIPTHFIFHLFNKDLFIDKNYIKDWYLNPAPNFFPDMAVYFLLMFLFSGNFIVASFVFSIMQFFAILFLFKYLFKLIMPLHYGHYFRLVFIFFSFFLLEYLFLGKDFTIAFYLLSNSYHTCSFVISLLALIILIKYINDNWIGWLIMLFVISTLSIASDKLFIVLFSFPAFATSVFFYKKLKLKKSLSLALMIIFSVFIGIILFKFLVAIDFAKFNSHQMFSFQNIKSSFDMLYDQMTLYMSEFTFKGIVTYLFFLGLMARIILFFYVRKKNNDFTFCIYLFFSICFDIAVFIAPVLNGNYSGFDTLRYNIYPFYFSALNNTLLIAYVLKSSRLSNYSLLGKLVLTSVIILILISGGFYFKVSGLKNYLSYYPDNVQKIDNIAKKNNLKCGVANYWNAKKTTMFSKQGLKVYAVYEDLSAQEHVINVKWFFSDNVFNYAIVKNLSDTVLFRSYFNTIQVINIDDNNYLIKTPEFKYQKELGYKPILIDK